MVEGDPRGHKLHTEQTLPQIEVDTYVLWRAYVLKVEVGSNDIVRLMRWPPKAEQHHRPQAAKRRRVDTGNR